MKYEYIQNILYSLSITIFTFKCVDTFKKNINMHDFVKSFELNYLCFNTIVVCVSLTFLSHLFNFILIMI